MKSMSCSLGRSSFGMLLVILLSFLILSLSAQFSRLNQNVLAQAVSVNQHGQSETNRLNLPDHEGADKPSSKSFIPQSAIQNLSPTSIGDQQLEKAEVIQKTAKLQMPFIANNGQMDERVKFYANTFGGTVFVTEDGEIVYALPSNSPDVETQCLASLMHSPNGISPLERGDKGVCNTTPISNDKNETHTRPLLLEGRTGIALREEFVGARIKAIQGEHPSVTKVNYFKGKDPSKWKTNISTYDMVSLGEVYDRIELKLKAYGNNVEKLFCVKPGADPDQIKIKLSGAKDCGVQNAECGIENPKSEFRNPKLRINEHGELEVETELGPVKFTKPIAYQEINGKRVVVSVEYSIQEPEAKSQRQEARSRKQETGQIGKRLIGSREKGMGRKGAYLTSRYQLSTENLQPETQNPQQKADKSNPQSAIQNLSSTSIGDPKSKIANRKLEYGFTVASYDKTKDLIIDPLLASTFLGGSSYEYGYSIAINSSGDVYVTGTTESSDFPTTTGAYDTSYNFVGYTDYDRDVFVSKLSGDLTGLLASTYLGGSYNENSYSIAIDSSGNIYITGGTGSSDFPTTVDAYDISYNGSDGFVSKLNGDLTSLLASTYLGGSYGDDARSIAIESSGNIYVAGETHSSDFPTTTDAYDTSFNGGYYDIFVSKLNNGLTSILASTFLGGSGGSDEYCWSIAINSSGDVYATGITDSSDFPTTTGSYDTSFNGGDNDGFISKLSGDLTKLLASTYLGGSGLSREACESIAIDSSGNIYVTGGTSSNDFPTTTGAYDTSFDWGKDYVFVSKLNGDLTNLLASTYLSGSLGESIAINSNKEIYVAGESDDIFILKLNSDLTNLLASKYLEGYSNESVYSMVIGSDGNIFVTGFTDSSNFPTTTGAYDTSKSGSYDAFVSKLDSNLSDPPTVSTGSATNVTINSATLDGSVNANGLSTTAWFEYGTYSGSYTSTSSTQSVSGTTASTVNINISGLSSGTTYFYRIVAQSSAGTSYGNEKSFKTTVDTTKSPIVTTGSATNVTSNSATLNGTVNANGLETYAWFDYSTTSGTYGNVSSTQSISGSSNTTVNINISGLKEATTYYCRIVAQNNSGTTYGSEKSFTTSDTSAPTGSISINGDATYTKSTSVTLTLSATDNAGITGYYISNSSTKPSASAAGWTSVTSTTSYSANVSYTLSSGDGSKTVYVWYKDNSGNVSNSASDSIILDTTAPTITITSPTSDDNYTVTSSVIAIGGIAFDSTSGISSVTWSNDKGGSGTASGTTSWLTTSISLLSGENIITVTATDGTGNTGTDKITVIYNTGAVSTPTPTLTPASSPTPILTPTTEPSEKGIISGYVVDKRGNPIESAKIRLKGTNSKILRKTISDEDGLFEFTDLDADTYIITAIKNGYKRAMQTITLEEGEEKEIEIEMKKKRIRGK